MAERTAEYKIEIKGTLQPYTAGPGRNVLWSIHEEGKPGPEGVHPLLNGDFLTVYDEKDIILWHGIVDLDFELLQQPNSEDPTEVKQQVFGHWVYGVQKYTDPEIWARMFFDRRRASVTRFRLPKSTSARL